jgi:hypothetical protein
MNIKPDIRLIVGIKVGQLCWDTAPDCSHDVYMTLNDGTEYKETRSWPEIVRLYEKLDTPLPDLH